MADPETDAGPPRVLIVCILLVISTLAAYMPLAGCGFVNYDDGVYVTDNGHVLQGVTWGGLSWASTNLEAGFWHPLTWLSLMLNVTLFGRGAASFHLANLLLHAASTGLLFGWLQRATGMIWRSAWVAALFALHPLHVESVAWVAERKDVLSTFFEMLALLFYVSHAQRHRRRDYVLAVVFFGCGLMSKTMVITMPLLLLLLDYWPLGRFSGGSARSAPAGGWRRLVGEKWPFVVSGLMAGLITLFAEKNVGAISQENGIPLAFRLPNAVVAYARYLQDLFWPANLAVIYPYPRSFAWGGVAAAAVLLGLITLFTFKARRQWPYLVVGWTWYWGTLLPVIGLIQVGSHSRADRYTYVPLVGIFIMLAWGVGDWWERRRFPKPVAGFLALACLGACAWQTEEQLSYWHDSGKLFRHTLAVTRDNCPAYNNLGTYLESQGDAAGAIDCYRKALQIDPHYDYALNNLGCALAGQGRFDQAISYYQATLRENTNYEKAYYNFGYALMNLGESGPAIAQFREAIRRRPDDIDAHYNLGNVLAMERRFEEAAGQFREVIGYQPDAVDAHVNLGNVLLLQNKFDEAVGQYTAVLKLNPGDASTHYNLGNALLKLNRRAEAVAQFQETLRLDPAHGSARQRLLEIKQPAPP